VTLNAFLA